MARVPRSRQVAERGRMSDEQPPPQKKEEIWQAGYLGERQRQLNRPRPDNPRAPAPFDRRDISAFQAMRQGRAQPHQQTLVLEWLVMAARTYEDIYRNDQRDHAFLAGQRSIGLQVVKLINWTDGDPSEGEQGQ